MALISSCMATRTTGHRRAKALPESLCTMLHFPSCKPRVRALLMNCLTCDISMIPAYISVGCNLQGELYPHGQESSRTLPAYLGTWVTISVEGPLWRI